MNRTRAFLIACLAVLALPASASAATFCVHDPEGCVGTDQPNLQAALNAAAGNGGNRDTIRLGVGLFNDGPAVNEVGSPVDIVGEASNQTAIRTLSNTSGVIILDIREPTSTISDMRVHHSSAAPFATGLKLAGDAERVVVTNQGIAGQFDGVQMDGTEATFVDGSVALVYPPDKQNRAIFMSTGTEAVIRNSYLEGTVGVSTFSAEATVSRTRIRAEQGVVAGSGSTVQVSDSRIVTPGPFDSNFQVAALAAAGNGAVTLNLDRVTAIGEGGGSYGVWLIPNDGAGNNVVADLQGSVLHGFSSDLRLAENGGSSTTLTSSWSAYDLDEVVTTGAVTYTPAGNLLDIETLDPGFRDAAGGDYRLAFDSPLVDRGDPAYAPLIAFDVLGLGRRRDGNGDATSRVDIGAFEYQRRAPGASAVFAPAAPVAGEQVSFDASASSDPDDEALAFAWSFDDGGTATGATAQHAFATPGPHSATVTVTDEAGVSSTATVNFDVQPAPAGPGPGPGAQPDPPELTRLSLKPKRFSVPDGTRIRYRLSEAARVTFVVQRRSGRRWVRVGRFADQGEAGRNSRRFSGRLRGESLDPGRYRLRARARDGDGLRSAPVLVRRFRIV